MPEPEWTEPERAKLKRLEAENRALQQEVEFLGKATAFFARKFPPVPSSARVW